MNGLKSKLNAAFRDLRTQGFLARQNFMCCSNCAGCALANRATELKDAGKADKIKGCVFYHNQDNDSFISGKDFYLAYGVLSTAKYGDIGLPTVEVGRMVVATLTRHGVANEWDGDPDKRILVKVSSK